MAAEKASLLQPLLRSEVPGGAPTYPPQSDGAYRVPSFADGLAEGPPPPQGLSHDRQAIEKIAGPGGPASAGGTQSRQVEIKRDEIAGNSAVADGYSQPRGAVRASSSGTGEGGSGMWGEGDGRWGDLGAFDEEQCSTPITARGTASAPEVSPTPLSARSGLSYDGSAGPAHTQTWKTLLDTSPSRNARQLSVHLAQQADADLVVLAPRHGDGPPCEFPCLPLCSGTGSVYPW